MRIFAGIVMLMLAACGYRTTDVVPDPAHSITVEQAFIDSANGLTKFKKILLEHDVALGMIVCKVQIDFNVSAQANEKGQATLSVAAPIQAIKLNGELSYTDESTANRGNKITYLLQSIYPELCTNAAAAAAKPDSTTAPAAGTPPAGKQATRSTVGNVHQSPMDSVAGARAAAEAAKNTMQLQIVR